ARMGVQTLVAVILLTLVVATAAIAIYTWLSGVTSTSPTEAQTLKERIRIDGVDVAYTASPGNYTFTIVVRNIGDVQVNVTGAYLIDPETELVVQNASNTSVGVVIAPGQAKNVLIFNVSDTYIVAGKAYVTKVVTESGIESRATIRIQP
ncbi:MAG: hypothetical protein F7C07_00310, partial [Desulfurococcales archaeon]|nr:hypothetical protein [Desulfurococcales archaeon]